MDIYKKLLYSIDQSITSTFSSIYKTMTNVDIHEVSLPNLNDFKRNYSTTMGLNGTISVDSKKIPLKGSVIITWEMNGYIKMAGMMMGETYTEYTSDIDDIGMEILNTTVGNAKVKLNELGVQIQMSLPTGFISLEKIGEIGKNVFSAIHVFHSDAGKICLIVNCLIDE